MEHKLVVLEIAMLLVVGAAAIGQPCAQLDEGLGGGRRVDIATAVPARPIVVCPDGDGTIDGVRSRRLAEAGATVTSADGDWLFADSGLVDPSVVWGENGGNSPVSVWLSRTDCRRADGVTNAIGDVGQLVLFEPPELIVPDTERFKQVVVVTSNPVLASQFSAVAELCRATGFGDTAFVVLNTCDGREPAVERIVVTLLMGTEWTRE